MKRLETHLLFEVYANERVPQPICMTITGESSAAPDLRDECFDYVPLCRWLTQVWPTTLNTPLLENRIKQVVAFVFAPDSGVRSVWVDLYKHRASKQALAVLRSA